ncbi:MAG: cell wall hydrolase [Lachnospiraceae bacterium]|nr:cell wall hydrolase [Lachnospiraceae bacterium]
MNFTKRNEEIQSIMEGQRIRNHIILGVLALCTVGASFGIYSKIASHHRHQNMENEVVEKAVAEKTAVEKSAVEMTVPDLMSSVDGTSIEGGLSEIPAEDDTPDLDAASAALGLTGSLNGTTDGSTDNDSNERSDSVSDGSFGEIFAGKFIANITDTLNVRAEADVDSELVGKMYPGCAGDILGTEGDWTRILSGEVEGYVKTEYILSGKDAEPMVEEYGKYIGTVTADLVRVRRDADMDSEPIAMLEQDDEVFVTDTLDGWYQILFNETWEGYVSADYMDVEYKLDTAITIEEEMARIQAAKEAEAARLAAEAKNTQTTTAQSSAVSDPVTVATQIQEPTAASYDDAYLLACLISMEAGYEPYEGQLAVANVVLNRLHSGSFGGSISSVIYAPGQFPSVNGSVMNGYLQNGPLPQAQQAANEALSGVNNIGGYMYFINVRYANYASYGDYSIIGNHCFH